MIAANNFQMRETLKNPEKYSNEKTVAKSKKNNVQTKTPDKTLKNDIQIRKTMKNPTES